MFFDRFEVENFEILYNNQIKKINDFNRFKN